MSGGLSSLSDAERLDWLRLIRSERIGPTTFFDLIKIYGSATDALAALPALAGRAGRSRVKIHPPEAAATELAQLNSLGGRMIAACEPEYPALLREIHDPPPVICVLGRSDLFAKPTVGIVGARNASASGRRFARDLAAELGQRGFVIASGMARGIDSHAHQGALASGTIAVLGSGADVIYPAENDELYRDIAANGVVLSEQPMGATPQARHFPRRNRIISGLSQGLVVVEANLKSGSLISARLALEQGREVFAVPGSPLDPRHRGTNDLIRQGAVLTESADDVVGGLTPMIGSAVAHRLPAPELPSLADKEGAKPGMASTQDRNIVTNLLSPTPVSVDEIIRQCQLTPATVLTILLELEFAGRLERHPGGRVSCEISKR